MICPSCGFENIQGLDSCANCGADLRTVDIPYPGDEFESRLVGEHLLALQPTTPVCLSPSTPVTEAITTMRERREEAVLVTEGDQLVGIFTERDALLKLAGKPMDGISLGDVMTHDPVVLRNEDSVAVAIHKMAVGHFRHIPIISDGRPTGIVSTRDLFRHLTRILA
jgi:CBS domain-containing protein